MTNRGKISKFTSKILERLSANTIDEARLDVSIYVNFTSLIKYYCLK